MKKPLPSNILASDEIDLGEVYAEIDAKVAARVAPLNAWLDAVLEQLRGTLPSRNTTWGYFGAISKDPVVAAHSFAAAQATLMAAKGLSAATARDYLDSRCGRHVADAVQHLDRPDVLSIAWLDRDIARFLKSYDPAEFRV